MASWSLSKVKSVLNLQPISLGLSIIVLLGLFLRVFNFQTNPVALNRDETSIGFTAHSLLKTGKDEHGVSWPINYQSFGDWKLIGYPIFDLPFVAILGLSEFSTRLPSILAGTVLIVLVFFLVKNLLTNFSPYHKFLPLLSALFLAISPWSVHLSRLAYEANLALFLFVIACLLFILAIKQKPILLLPSSFCLILTMITYHSYQIFTPLMLVGFLIIYRDEFLKFFKKQKLIFVSAVMIFCIGLSLIVLVGTQNSNTIKFSGLSVFSTDLYKDQIFANRNYLSNQPTLVSRMYVNRPVLILEKLSSNFFKALSADFLFFNGGANGSHDTKGLGKLFLFQAPLLLLGVWSLFVPKPFLNSKGKKVLSVWFLASLVAPVITLEPAHATRFSPSIIPFAITSALGLLYLFEKLKSSAKKIQLAVFTALIIFFGFDLSRAFITYYLVAPIRDVDNWHWYAKPLVEKIDQLNSQYQEIYFAGKTWSPYIYFLFYNRFDSNLLQTQLIYDPVDYEGFQYAKKLGKIHFGQIPWDLLYKPDAKRLFIIKKTELPTDKQAFLQTNLVYTLTHPNSNVTWYFIEN